MNYLIEALNEKHKKILKALALGGLAAASGTAAYNKLKRKSFLRRHAGKIAIGTGILTGAGLAANHVKNIANDVAEKGKKFYDKHKDIESINAKSKKLFPDFEKAHLDYERNPNAETLQKFKTIGKEYKALSDQQKQFINDKKEFDDYKKQQSERFLGKYGVKFGLSKLVKDHINV